jgi:hypothetical protein
MSVGCFRCGRSELRFVYAQDVFDAMGGERSERGWEGVTGEGGLFVVEAEVAGAGAGTGVEVNAGGAEAEVGGKAEGGVVAVEFADAGDSGVVTDEGVQGVERGGSTKFVGDILERGMSGVERFAGEAALVVEAFPVGCEGEGGFAEGGGEVVGFEGGEFRGRQGPGVSEVFLDHGSACGRSSALAG